MVACCISIYSVIDGAAVRIAPPIPYTVAVIGVSALLMAPAVLARYGRQAVAGEWRANWPRIVLVGILTLVTYALVLQAYALGRVSYAGAIREISVVFAALVGWRWLGEGFGGWRVAGALLIFAGILVIAIVGEKMYQSSFDLQSFDYTIIRLMVKAVSPYPKQTLPIQRNNVGCRIARSCNNRLIHFGWAIGDQDIMQRLLIDCQRVGTLLAGDPVIERS